MKFKLLTAAALAVTGTVALAEGHASGDAEAGETVFNQCKSCHMIEDAEGETIVRGGRTGPNLWGIPGRLAGSVDGFRYSDAMVSVGADLDYMWEEEGFVAYVQDPTGWLRETLDDGSARGKMSYKIRKEEDALNVWAYLASVSPAPEMAEEGAATN